jgi:hypothetical protein
MNDPEFTAEELHETRLSLHRVAVHVVARARSQATNRFSLRVTPGGFGTPEFAPELRRVRVSGATLVVERDPTDGARAMAVHLNGLPLATAAAFAGTELHAPLDVGHDTPPVGDAEAPLVIHDGAARFLAGWLARGTVALDRLLAALPGHANPTAVRLWPEHFDVAIDAEVAPGVRANFGMSVGDAFCEEPYAYVGPFGSERPGNVEFWNAPFGAYAPRSSLGGDHADEMYEFMLDGARHLSG